ncbi:MAG: hypothetical protein JW929_11360 [Anaerolineales bacterium]|nr:hypothetical protein [Anaerolineales bacterium]
MVINIIGTESLGVRGLSCSVQLKDRKIFIDPGIALGYSRGGYLPHPFQVAVGGEIRGRIVRELENSSDVIVSHFDGDHCPLDDPNPYQLGIRGLGMDFSGVRIWAKGWEDCPPKQQARRKALTEKFSAHWRDAEGVRAGPLTFSLPVPHGRREGNRRTVMMSRIEEGGTVFVHASDIQLLDDQTVEAVLAWRPDIVLASGPPVYLGRAAGEPSPWEHARRNAIKLSRMVDALILDHHLLRSTEGLSWLEEVKRAAGHPVLCAAEFMKRQPLFLEGWRKQLYEWLPVPDAWHAEYASGKADAGSYRIPGWKALIDKGRITPCRWYPVCPIREYTERGELERYWVEAYCLVGNRNCLRYRMEEQGKPHPDNLLPDGEIREGLLRR